MDFRRIAAGHRHPGADGERRDVVESGNRDRLVFEILTSLDRRDRSRRASLRGGNVFLITAAGRDDDDRGIPFARACTAEKRFEDPISTAPPTTAAAAALPPASSAPWMSSPAWANQPCWIAYSYGTASATGTWATRTGTSAVCAGAGRAQATAARPATNAALRVTPAGGRAAKWTVDTSGSLLGSSLRGPSGRAARASRRRGPRSYGRGRAAPSESGSLLKCWCHDQWSTTHRSPSFPIVAHSVDDAVPAALERVQPRLAAVAVFLLPFARRQLVHREREAGGLMAEDLIEQERAAGSFGFT